MQRKSSYPATRLSDGVDRALVVIRPIKACETLLRDTPLLLTPTQDTLKSVCANWLRFLQDKPLSNLLVLSFAVYQNVTGCV